MRHSLGLAAVLLAGCGAGVENSTTASASGLELPDPLVSVSQSGSVFSSTFSGADESLSFSQDLSVFAGGVVTGGGYVLGDLGGHASFGFAAGVDANNQASGHLVYIDHGLNFRLRSTEIQAVNVL